MATETMSADAAGFARAEAELADADFLERVALRLQTNPPVGLPLPVVWAGVMATYGACGWALWWLTGIPPWVSLPAVLVGCAIAPLQLLSVADTAFLVYIWGGFARPAPAFWAAVGQSALFLVSFGFASALGLVLATRFMPPRMVRVVSSVGVPLSRQYAGLMALVPEPVLILMGAVFTFASEFLFISPVAVCMLFAVGQLKYAGEDFDRPAAETKRERSKRRTAIVLLHGNGFNECQWLFPRFLLRSLSWSDDVEIVTVNIFSGPSMRAHTAHTRTVRACSTAALAQIQMQFKAKDLAPDNVILIGHSLGGLMAAHIAEHHRDQLPVKHVVAWSAPFRGSDLLQQGQRWLGVAMRDGSIRDEFCPTAEATAALRKRMEASIKAGRSSYFAISGGCDHLVRPHSALLDFFKPEHTVLMPYLGHFNIKVSLSAWRHVIDHLERDGHV